MVSIGLQQPPSAKKKDQWNKLKSKLNSWQNENALRDFKSKLRVSTQAKILFELAQCKNATSVSGKRKRHRAEKKYDKYSKI